MKQISLQCLALALMLLASARSVPAQVPSPQPEDQVRYEVHPGHVSRQVTVGVLLFPGFEMLDAYGPMEMWGSLKHAPARFWGGEEKRVGVRLVTIAATRGEIPSNQGPKQ